MSSNSASNNNNCCGSSSSSSYSSGGGSGISPVSSPNITWTSSCGTSSPTLGQKIKKPRRLRKQINNDKFKQCYFELKVNDSIDRNQFVPTSLGSTSTSVSTTSVFNTSTTCKTTNSSLKRKESYEILQFETEQEKDEETLYQERIKNEIKANSHHFCINSKKKKKNATCQQEVCQQQPSIQTQCNTIQQHYPQHPVTTPSINQPMSILYNPLKTEPVNTQISHDNTELLLTILQLLASNNKN